MYNEFNTFLALRLPQDPISLSYIPCNARLTVHLVSSYFYNLGCCVPLHLSHLL
jgi:hypothetical protein